MQRILLILTFAAALLIACGSNGESEPDSDDTTPAPASSSTQTSDSQRPLGIISVRDLQRGDCFRRPPDTSAIRDVELVSCLLDWEVRVISSFEVGATGDYPIASYFEDQADAFCHPNSTGTIAPGPNGWEEGDRTVLCIQER